MCANYTTAASCNAQSNSDCAWDGSASACRGGWHSSPSNMWRDTTEAMMAGHWYSTQAVGKCNSSSAAAADGDSAGADQVTFHDFTPFHLLSLRNFHVNLESFTFCRY